MPTAKDYIENEDFEGAYGRYMNARKNWKDHWFDVCYTIAKSVGEIALAYVIDPIRKTITKIGNIVRRGRPIKPENQNHNSYVYFIRMFSNGNQVFHKVGKAKDVDERMKALGSYNYRREKVKIDKVEVVKTWEFPTEKYAESFESFAQEVLSKIHTIIPNDRFLPFNNENEIVELIDNKYKAYSMLMA